MTDDDTANVVLHGGPHDGEVHQHSPIRAGMDFRVLVDTGDQAHHGYQVYAVREAPESDGAWHADYVGPQSVGPGGFTRDV